VTEEAPDDESLVVRVGDGPALVLVRMEVAHSRRSLIVQAALRPDLAQTVVGVASARALNLSPGQGVMLQLARRAGHDSGLCLANSSRWLSTIATSSSRTTTTRRHCCSAVTSCMPSGSASSATVWS